MKFKFVAAAVLSGLISAVYADDAVLRNAERIIELKDGSKVVVFKDKKMAMRDKNGRTAHMKPGHVMETKDGQQIIMIGNEVARLDWLTRDGHGQGAWGRMPN
jgi:hypothetical protein